MPTGRFATIPLDVVCRGCGKTFVRKHGKFPKYCSVQCREPRDLASVLRRNSVKCKSGCIEWTGSLSNGYGQVSVSGTPRRAHRVSYELANGQIPKGLFVCHSCDNPKCINPKHLFLGTHKDNMKDCHNKKRYRQGDNHSKAVLTSATVKAMRAMRAKGTRYVAIARAFDVKYLTAYNAITGASWRHIKA